MGNEDARVAVVETLDTKVADFVEASLRRRAIPVWRSNVTLQLIDARLRQRAIRLEVRPCDEAVARQLADDVMSRRARLLSFPPTRRGYEPDLGGDGGGADGFIDVGGCDGGDGGGHGGHH
jgi:hypothetical protein